MDLIHKMYYFFLNLKKKIISMTLSLNNYSKYQIVAAKAMTVAEFFLIGSTTKLVRIIDVWLTITILISTHRYFFHYYCCWIFYLILSLCRRFVFKKL